MDSKKLETEYRRFFTNGGYRIARMIKEKAEMPCSENHRAYGIMSLIKWQTESEGSFEAFERDMLDKEIEKHQELYDFICALNTLMENLPRNWGEVLEKRYYYGIKTKSNSSGFRKRTVENALTGLINVIEKEEFDDFDFIGGGLRTVTKINRIVEDIRTLSPETSDKIGRTINAVKVYKQTRTKGYIDSVMEFANKLSVDERTAKVPLNLHTEVSGDSVRVYLTPNSYSINYIYKLKIDKYTMATSEEPEFLIDREILDGGHKIVIIPELRNLSGMILKANEKQLGIDKKLYLDIVCPRLYRYQLLENNKVVANSDKPSFRYRAISGNEYKIRMIANENNIEEDLFIQKEFRNISGKSGLEQRTDIGNSQNMNLLMLKLMRSIDILRKTDEEKMNQICSFCWARKEEKAVDLFWELAILLELE